MANPNGKKSKRAAPRKIWFVEHPTAQYSEDVKLLALQNNLRILDARFKDDYEGDIVAEKTPELTIDEDYVKISRNGKKPEGAKAESVGTSKADAVLAEANKQATSTLADADGEAAKIKSTAEDEAAKIKKAAEDEAAAIVKAAQLQAEATNKAKK